MGDSANILIKGLEDEPGVYLYTHWAGSHLPQVLQTALAKGWRWDDPPYLARIIFCEMVKGREMEEDGFGIATRIDEGGERVLVVDCDEETVTYRDQVWTFEEFTAIPTGEINSIWAG